MRFPEYLKLNNEFLEDLEIEGDLRLKEWREYYWFHRIMIDGETHEMVWRSVKFTPLPEKFEALR